MWIPVLKGLKSLSSGRSWGHGRQEGCARSGSSSTAFVARKAKIMQWIVFGIMRVTDVLSAFTFAVWNVFTYSISNFRKIFVAESDSYIFFTPFSYEHFIFHIYSPSLKCRRVLFDCQSRHKSSEQKLPYMIAVHFNCSFINHKWDLVCSSFSKALAPNIQVS